EEEALRRQLRLQKKLLKQKQNRNKMGSPLSTVEEEEADEEDPEAVEAHDEKDAVDTQLQTDGLQQVRWHPPPVGLLDPLHFLLHVEVNRGRSHADLTGVPQMAPAPATGTPKTTTKRPGDGQVAAFPAVQPSSNNNNSYRHSNSSSLDSSSSGSSSSSSSSSRPPACWILYRPMPSALPSASRPDPELE
ncbi:unnamed protein product, partial [Polarella glacialis]